MTLCSPPLFVNVTVSPGLTAVFAGEKTSFAFASTVWLSATAEDAASRAAIAARATRRRRRVRIDMAIYRQTPPSRASFRRLDRARYTFFAVIVQELDGRVAR